jgi:hypothetical protein
VSQRDRRSLSPATAGEDDKSSASRGRGDEHDQRDGRVTLVDHGDLTDLIDSSG